jgi:hypothetical protein
MCGIVGGVGGIGGAGGAGAAGAFAGTCIGDGACKGDGPPAAENICTRLETPTGGGDTVGGTKVYEGFAKYVGDDDAVSALTLIVSGELFGLCCVFSMIESIFSRRFFADCSVP